MKPKIQIVILCAGYGSRLRPLTWSKPKPLVAIAGRTSLDYLLDEFKDLGKDWDPEFIFVISPNGWSIFLRVLSTVGWNFGVGNKSLMLKRSFLSLRCTTSSKARIFSKGYGGFC